MRHSLLNFEKKTKSQKKYRISAHRTNFNPEENKKYASIAKNQNIVD